ncbi:MAG: hypothetical protein J3K34DRAFT_520276 [Monoraphidium minutum]|nr:MAG: hypothetical protein J3K34DRAFT_520276 [Monoraphidium minutum]
MSLFSKITSVLSNPGAMDKAICMGFGRFDKDKSGFIEKSEVLGVLETVCQTLGLGFVPPGSMIDAAFAKAGGADDRVDKVEFGALVRQLFSMVAEEKKAEAAAGAQ